jgi:glycosyltransferase involved in cell wall biosynthesis
MRILISSITYAPTANGQAVFTSNLARHLSQSGHEVAVLFPSEKGNPYQDIYDGIHRVGVRSFHLNFWHPDAFTPLWKDAVIERLFNQFRPDVVHIQDHYPLSWSVAQVARRRGLPVVGTNHFVPDNVAPYLPFIARYPGFFQSVLWKWVLLLYNRLDCVTVQSQTASHTLLQAGLTTPLVPISCGIDLERFHVDPLLDRVAVRRQFGLDPQKVIFLFVGRIDAEKRIDLMMHALSLFGSKQVTLAIAGRGTETASLQALSRHLGLADQVRFLGYVSDADLPALLNSVDIFVMPSEAELLSIATLEAMACGRPILAARARALPELVEDHMNGRLFRPGDPYDAADAIEDLLKQKESWPAMGAISQRRSATHSWTAVLHSYDAIYHSLAGGRTTSRRLVSSPAALQ